ncbi:MAG: hypothetical protein ACI9G1_004882 [Pirellulaceae bacterium]|jgi:hypothetical protein
MSEVGDGSFASTFDKSEGVGRKGLKSTERALKASATKVYTQTLSPHALESDNEGSNKCEADLRELQSSASPRCGVRRLHKSSA